MTSQHRLPPSARVPVIKTDLSEGVAFYQPFTCTSPWERSGTTLLCEDAAGLHLARRESMGEKNPGKRVRDTAGPASPGTSLKLHVKTKGIPQRQRQFQSYNERAPGRHFLPDLPSSGKLQFNNTYHFVVHG